MTEPEPTFAPRLRQQPDGSFVAVRFRRADWILYGVCETDEERAFLVAEALQSGHPTTLWWRVGSWSALYIQAGGKR